MPKSTMSEISYGINNPRDLYEKLILEGDKINEDPHPYDLFNFFVTAAVLNEWIKKYYAQNSLVENLIEALETKNLEKLPEDSQTWISDKKCLPNKGCVMYEGMFITQCKYVGILQTPVNIITGQKKTLPRLKINL